MNKNEEEGEQRKEKNEGKERKKEGNVEHGGSHLPQFLTQWWHNHYCMYSFRCMLYNILDTSGDAMALFIVFDIMFTTWATNTVTI